MDGDHDGVDIPLPGSFWVGWGDQPKYKLCWGPWDYGTQEMRSRMEGYHDGACVPVPYSYGHSVVLDWKPI